MSRKKRTRMTRDERRVLWSCAINAAKRDFLRQMEVVGREVWADIDLDERIEREAAEMRGHLGSALPRPPVDPSSYVEGEPVHFDRIEDVLALGWDGWTRDALK